MRDVEILFPRGWFVWSHIHDSNLMNGHSKALGHLQASITIIFY